MERLGVDEMRRERDAGIQMGVDHRSEPHAHPGCPCHLGSLPSFSSLTIRLPRKPHIVAISVQCPCVSAFLSCSCLIDTPATQKTCFPDF
jgi:hypothetical protein